MERAEASLAALEDELADPAMWSSPTRRERATERHAKAKRAVEQAYAAWEEATRLSGAAGRAGRPGRGTMAPEPPAGSGARA